MINLIKENIRISLESIRSHLLRTILTVLIIAFGIMALVGILTSIDAIKFYLTENFSSMGANSFTIRNRSMNIQIGNEIHRSKYYEPITYDIAMSFKDQFDFPAYTSVHTYATGIATLKYGSVKTNPNVSVIGSDDNYVMTSGNELSKGRNFIPSEIYYGSAVAIIGSTLSKKLFKEKVDPLGKFVSIGEGKYMIIGILKEKGSSIGFSSDRDCIIPLNNVRQYFPRPNMSFTITVMSKNAELLKAAEGEARGLMRRIRQTPLSSEDDFDITKSDRLVDMFLENIKYITLSATIIGLITLLGAAIGLMNIMLVSVTERTREIGIRKAMGATRRTIRNQFLFEAIVIAQIGAILGIIAGIAMGNILSSLIGSSFIIPWQWIILGIVLCFIVALVSGILPATKAANLDPIESLRYE